MASSIYNSHNSEYPKIAHSLEDYSSKLQT